MSGGNQLIGVRVRLRIMSGSACAEVPLGAQARRTIPSQKLAQQVIEKRRAADCEREQQRDLEDGWSGAATEAKREVRAMAATENAAMTVLLRCHGRDDVCSTATSINGFPPPAAGERRESRAGLSSPG